MATHIRMKDTLDWSDTDKVLIEEKREELKDQGKEV